MPRRADEAARRCAGRQLEPGSNAQAQRDDRLGPARRPTTESGLQADSNTGSSGGGAPPACPRQKSARSGVVSVFTSTERSGYLLPRWRRRPGWKPARAAGRGPTTSARAGAGRCPSGRGRSRGRNAGRARRTACGPVTGDRSPPSPPAGWASAWRNGWRDTSMAGARRCRGQSTRAASERWSCPTPLRCWTPADLFPTPARPALSQVVFGAVFRRVTQRIFCVLDVDQVVAVVGLAEEHVEAQAVGRVDAAFDQLRDVAVTAPQDARPGAGQPVVRCDPADAQADARQAMHCGIHARQRFAKDLAARIGRPRRLVVSHRWEVFRANLFQTPRQA